MSNWAEEHNWIHDKPSRAVCFWDGKRGWVLYWVGCDIDFEVTEGMSRDMEDLGLVGRWSRQEKPSFGLSIWEGKYVQRSTDDDTTTADGKFRPLRPEEVGPVLIGQAPWDEKEWRIATSGAIAGGTFIHPVTELKWSDK